MIAVNPVEQKGLGSTRKLFLNALWLFIPIVLLALSFATRGFTVPIGENIFDEFSEDFILGRIAYYRLGSAEDLQKYGGLLVGLKEENVYFSQSGAHGAILNAIQEILHINPADFPKPARIGMAVFLAAVIGISMVKALQPYSPLAVFITMVLFFQSYGLNVMGSSLYWAIGLILLPFTAAWIVYPLVQSGRIKPIYFWLIIAALVLLKALSGYEYITNTVLVAAIPVLYYELKSETGAKTIIRRLVMITLVGVAAFIAALVIHSAQLALWQKSLSAILFIFQRASVRTLDPGAVCGSSSMWGVFWTYSGFRASIAGNLTLASLHTAYIALAVIIIFLYQANKSLVTTPVLSQHFRIRLPALAVATGASFLASWSWLAAKNHMACHSNPIVIFLPFGIMLFFLIGALVDSILQLSLMGMTSANQWMHKSRSSRLVIVLTIIFAVAAVISFRGFAYNLPYNFDVSDHGMWLETEKLLRGQSLDKPFIPIGHYIRTLELLFIHSVTPDGASLGHQYLVGRLANIYYTLLLLAVTYQSGKQLHSRAAGLVAVVILMIHPELVASTKTIQVNVLAWLFGMSSMMFVLRFIQVKKPLLLVTALVSGVVALFIHSAMWPMLLVVLIGGAAQLPSRLRAIGFILMVTLGILVVALNVDLPNLSILIGASLSKIYQGVTSCIVLAYLLIGLIRRSNNVDDTVVLKLFALLTYILFAILPVTEQWNGIPIVLGASLVWGFLAAAAVRHRAALAAAAALVFVLPAGIDLWKYDQKLLMPDTRVLTANWLIEHLPSGTQLATEYDHGEFATLGQIYPEHKFVVHQVDSVYELSLQEYAQRGIEYVIADEWNYGPDTFFREDESQTTAFLNQVETALDLTNPRQLGRQGPARLVIRVPALQQNPMHIFLGNEIILKGYDISSTRLHPGEVVELVFYWSLLAETNHDYLIFAHVIGPDGELVAQQDGPPLGLGDPTYYWLVGSFKSGKWFVDLPDDLLSGTYELRVGMYDRDTQIRLQAVNQDDELIGDSIKLTDIEITNP